MPQFLSALCKGGGPLRLRKGGGLAAPGCVSVQKRLPLADGLLLPGYPAWSPYGTTMNLTSDFLPGHRVLLFSHQFCLI